MTAKLFDTPGTLHLMAALLEVGPDGGTREHLEERAGIATTTFYRALKSLSRRGLVREEGGRYSLPLSLPYNYQFKRWLDYERLYELDEQTRNRVLNLREHALAHLGENLKALWLVGSAAHRAMHEESDLDLLVVVEKSTDYHPRTPYPVHFVLITQEEFQERIAAREGFILTALRYGLILHDRNFAQKAYSLQLDEHISAGELHEFEAELDERREQLRFFLERGAFEEAREALSGYAVQLTRRLLRVFGVLPAGKEDLLHACRSLLGSGLAGAVERALNWPREFEDPGGMLELARTLANYHYRFSRDAAHFEELAGLASSGREEPMLEMLRSLFSEIKLHSGTADLGADAILQRDEQVYLIEVKSLKGPCTAAPIHQILRYVDRFKECEDRPALPVLLVNTYREIPLLERPKALSSQAQEVARKHGVLVRSIQDLIQAHSVAYLEERPLAEVGAQFLTREPTTVVTQM